jgi:site-specific DNA recombinase
MAEFPVASVRLAIYARVSTEEQREGQNIDSQIVELERFSRDKAWPIVATYKDDGWSGGVMERPDLDRLRDDAQKGLFDAVLINDVDRLARDVAHLGVIKRDLEKKGIRVIFRKLPGDTSPTYNLMVNILGSFAEFEREMITDRTRRGRRHKVEVRKQYLGGNTAYGYRYVPKDRLAGAEGRLEVNSGEAAVVAKMFAWVDEEGLSARRVLNRLNELSVPPKMGAAQWARSSVLRILRSEIYSGVWYYNKFQGCEPQNTAASPRYRKHGKSSVRRRPKSEWIPLALPDTLRIVPRERWERVQRQLDRNITFSPRNEKHAYLLKGLVRCGACGAMYGGDPCHGKFYYRCIARCKGKPSVTEYVLDKAVMDAVREVLIKPEVILKPVRQLQAAESREHNERAQAAKAAQMMLTRLRGEEERVLEAYRTGVITPSQLGRQLEVIEAKRTGLDGQATQDKQTAPQAFGDIEKNVLEYCAEAARNLANFTPEQWRTFLRTVIQTVIFEGGQIRIQGHIPVGEANAELRFLSPVFRQTDGL